MKTSQVHTDTFAPAHLSQWKDIATSDLPAIGQEILLLDRRTLKKVIAVHRLDGGHVPPPDTYWDVQNDMQYAIFEKWTHWCAIPPIPL